jgi:uncharacterized membrane protein
VAQLTFSMLSCVLKNPTQKALLFAWSTLNAYLTIILMFLATSWSTPHHLQSSSEESEDDKDNPVEVINVCLMPQNQSN